MEQSGHNLVVRNTFIDAVLEEEDEADDPLARTRSDPTGGRSKAVLQLGRIPLKPQPITVQEGSLAEEAGDDETLGLGGSIVDVVGPDEDDDHVLNGLEGLGGHDDDDEDEDDAGDLMRTVSTATAYSTGYGMEPMSITTTSTGYLGVPGVGPMGPWMYPPYSMFGGFNGMYPPYPYDRPAAAGPSSGLEESAPSEGRPPTSPALGGIGPPIGMLHSFHQETRDMGQVSPDFRQFTKVGYEGRLSVVSESRVHTDGLQRYLVQFSSGELSRADGVGFVFSPRLPCAKNIQRIVSIFVNQRGRICMRVFADIVRASAYVKPLELGDWVDMAVDLDKKVATFNIWARTPTGWPPLAGRPASTAEFPFGNKLGRLNQAGQKPVKLNVGHLACVVKNVGVTVTLSS